MDGRVHEGAHLTKDYFSPQLGIGKSPVREGLTRLESERLLQIEPRRGAHLRRFTLEEGAIKRAQRLMRQHIAEVRDKLRRYVEHPAAQSRPVAV